MTPPPYPPGPPYGPPPGGPPPGGPPPGGPSRLRPPWRDAPPGEHASIIGWAIAGFLQPWVLLGLGVCFFFLGLPMVGVVLVALTALADIAGPVVMLTAERRDVRGAAYGTFIAFLTQVIAGAIGVVVLFGWCVSTLNDM